MQGCFTAMLGSLGPMQGCFTAMLGSIGPMQGCFSGDPDVDGEIPRRFSRTPGSGPGIRLLNDAMQVCIASGGACTGHRKRNACRRHGDRTAIPACAAQRCHPDVHDRLPSPASRDAMHGKQHAGSQSQGVRLIRNDLIARIIATPLFLSSSSQRKLGSICFNGSRSKWIPAFAGMTVKSSVSQGALKFRIGRSTSKGGMT